MNTELILKTALNVLNEKKARELKAVKVNELTALTDYFIFATATSNTHVRSLADEVDFKLGEMGLPPKHIEGKATGWLLLDCGTVIVHVFTAENREFYGLDQMWSDGENLDLTAILDNALED
jgi:ribosome-associated protein